MALTLALVLNACGGGEPAAAPEPELVDVDMGTDAFLQTRFDQRGPRPVPGVSGLVPADFPMGVPLLSGTGLIDFGRAANGFGYIVLQSPGSAADSVGRQLELLREAGWRTAAEGTAWTATKGATRLRMRIDAIGEVAELRIEYKSN